MLFVPTLANTAAYIPIYGDWVQKDIQGYVIEASLGLTVYNNQLRILTKSRGGGPDILRPPLLGLPTNWKLWRVKALKITLKPLYGHLCVYGIIVCGVIFVFTKWWCEFFEGVHHCDYSGNIFYASPCVLQVILKKKEIRHKCKRDTKIHPTINT